MRYKVVFLTGLGIGFVIGARAGRERYEQLRKLARKAWDSPSVQQAAGALQAQAANYAKSAGGKVADRAGAARAKVGEALHDRVPGMRARESNGHQATDGRGTYVQTPGTAEGPPGG
jgi:hypothetical protein